MYDWQSFAQSWVILLRFHEKSTEFGVDSDEREKEKDAVPEYGWLDPTKMDSL